MKVLFADSGYWVALYDFSDQLHRRARQVTRDLGPCRIVTSEMVMVEFLNHVSRGGDRIRNSAVDAERELRMNPNVDVEPQTSLLFRNAVARYSSRTDQRWSLTDCASFLIMEQRGITEALAYDRDFVQAGFRALLRDT